MVGDVLLWRFAGGWTEEDGDVTADGVVVLRLIVSVSTVFR